MSNKSFITSIVIFLITIAMVALISRRGEPLVVKTNLENLPMEINGYRGKEDVFPDSVYKELNADKHVYRHYRSEDGRRVDLYIGYYGTAKSGRTGHNPNACLSGGGWGIVESRKENMNPGKYQEKIVTNYVLAKKGEVYEIVLHWYQTSGKRVLSSGIQQNIQRFVGKVLNNRNDGAFVQISVLTEEEDIKEAKVLVKSFAEKIINVLPDYWPIEK